MKNMKKIFALILATMLVLASLTVAFADVTYSITVHPSGAHVSIEGKTFKAYKLFDATYADTNNDNKNDAFAYSITKDNYFYKNAMGVLDDYFDFITTADANVMTVQVKDNVTFDQKAAYELTEKLNKVENLFKNAPVAGSGTGTAKSGTDQAVIDNLPSAGYYLVTGEAAPLSDSESTVVAAIALTTTQPSATIEAKVDAPDIDKTLDNAIDSENHENQKSIGDKVHYTISTNVPDMTGYTTKYFFNVTDTLSKGLTLVDDDTNSDEIPDGFTITIGTGNDAFTLTRVKDADAAKTNPTRTYYIEKGAYDATNGTTFTIVFSKFIQYRGVYNNETQKWPDTYKGWPITITYDAILNDSAVIGNAGNPNKVKLIYSNNPNEEGTGDNDKPGNGDKTGETPDHETKTYVTGIELKKVDKGDHTKTLSGVTFKMEGTNLNDVVETRYDRFVPLTNAEKADSNLTNKWYLLNDGTYTQDAPVTEGDNKNVGSYAETTPGYKKVADASFNPSFQKADGDTVTYTGVTDANGLMSFTGLSAGTYTLTELKTLDGYNLLKDPITITVNAKTKTESGKTVFDGWEVKKGETALSANATSFLYEFEVENATGVELPSTGGMGTTILYVGGSILVILAAVLLITKRRMNAED